MKMKVIDRILLALYALMVTLALAITAACLVWPDACSAAAVVLQNMNTPMWRWIGYAVLAVLIVWSIRMIVLAFQRERKGDRGSVAIQNTGDGAVRVSVAAMDTLVRQAIGQVDGVVNIKTRIVNHEDSITVQIDMMLTSDAHIPNVTMLMQRNIKRFIEEFSGIAVREVVILVSDIKALEAPVQPTMEGSVPPVLVEPEKVEGTAPHVEVPVPVPEVPVEQVSVTDEAPCVAEPPVQEPEQEAIDEAEDVGELAESEEPAEAVEADAEEPAQGEEALEAEEDGQDEQEHAQAE